MDIKSLGGKGAAQKMFKDGQGLESNPFRAASEAVDHDAFNWEMHRLQREELQQELADMGD